MKPLESIVQLLATSLGEESARAVVEREAREANLTHATTREDIVALLRRIERLPGTAGLAARLAISRIERGVPVLSNDATTALPTAARKDLAVEDLVAMLAASLGDDQARVAVGRAASAIGVHGARLSDDEAARALDWLTAQGGTVSTVARFAKARLMLKK